MNIAPVDIWAVAKVFAIVGLFIYLIFALVVVRQVQLMIDTLEVGFEVPVKYLSYIHLILAIVVLIFAFVVL